MAENGRKPIHTFSRMAFEEYDAGILAASGRTVLTGAEEAPWIQEMLVLDDLVLQVFQDGAANYFESEADPDRISLVVSLPSPTFMSLNGTELDQNRMGVVRPGDSPLTHSTGIARLCAISLPADRFGEFAASHGEDPVERLWSGEPHVAIRRRAWHRINRLVSRVLHLARDETVLASRRLQDEVKNDLITAFLDAVVERIPCREDSGRPRAERRRVAADVRAYLDEVSDRSGSVFEMARFVGLPVRTLRNIVREMFGTSPKRLLDCQKLNQIHMSLLEAQPERTVTDIAYRHGVWELGRLAQRYRALFGEPPSATLARSPSAVRSA